MSTLYELTGQMAAIEAALEETGGELTPELEELWAETAESLQAKVDTLGLPDWVEVELKVRKSVLKDRFKDAEVTPAGVSFVKNQQIRFK